MTHKEGCPFRVIFSERGTWQHSLGLYLQRSLSVLAIDDPFLLRNPNEVNTFLNTLGKKEVGAFSADVKDLYYSLPQDPILEAPCWPKSVSSAESWCCESGLRAGRHDRRL
ncbi:hypothetical protein HPB48_001302 [Haemaphysalis longicornis]|uniref:Uncharacterized protein n=1 Tax=Haemaphysalis longicornis TaxID=44386 RepID=A0A9J6FPX3_HAELO|nr:hypothetical protein HPB48_001302 [Haemaphysalis longicornis]